MLTSSSPNYSRSTWTSQLYCRPCKAAGNGNSTPQMPSAAGAKPSSCSCISDIVEAIVAGKSWAHVPQVQADMAGARAEAILDGLQEIQHQHSGRREDK